MRKRRIAIVGFGRFGRLWAELFRGEEVRVVDKKGIGDYSDLKGADWVFYAVPISAFEEALKSSLPFLDQNTLVVELLSVKVFPLQVLRKSRKIKGFSFVLSHPLFGPDSWEGSFSDKKIVICEREGEKEKIKDFLDFLRRAGLKVIFMKAREHDKEMARTQAVTHFIARTLKSYGFSPSKNSPFSSLLLGQISETLSRDSLSLFYDILLYNPYALKEIFSLERAKERVVREVFREKRKRSKIPIFGIQGGRGSFNEMALQDYTTQKGILHFKTCYLYTTEKVLRALNQGEIDYGVFAFFNSRGGWVRETLDAVQRYYFKVKDVVGLNISHHLMIKKGVPFSRIKRIMAHPQVFRQCQGNLKKKYPHLEQVVGKGELIDTAKAAKALAEGKLPSSTAILGPKILAEIYDFEIVESNLQDLKDNTTYFLVVER